MTFTFYNQFILLILNMGYYSNRITSFFMFLSHFLLCHFRLVAIHCVCPFRSYCVSYKNIVRKTKVKMPSNIDQKRQKNNNNKKKFKSMHISIKSHHGTMYTQRMMNVCDRYLPLHSSESTATATETKTHPRNSISA